MAVEFERKDRERDDVEEKTRFFFLRKNLIEFTIGRQGDFYRFRSIQTSPN